MRIITRRSCRIFPILNKMFKNSGFAFTMLITAWDNVRIKYNVILYVPIYFLDHSLKVIIKHYFSMYTEHKTPLVPLVYIVPLINFFCFIFLLFNCGVYCFVLLLFVSWFLLSWILESQNFFVYPRFVYFLWTS